MGFTAIWISPIVMNINGSAASGAPYHGFWSKDITQLNPHFGTADDLKALAKAVHDRDMLLMVDVVANNFAYAGPGASAVYSDFVPFNDKKYFHNFCYISNYDNDNDAQQCWLGSDVLSLPDLNTELDVVKSTWDQWSKDVVANYSIDGFRIDAAKHVAKPFWTQFQKDGSGVYTVGEVLSDNATYACNYMSEALNGILNYPMWYLINSTYLATPPLNMTILQYEYTQTVAACQDTTLLGTFTENQDQPRFAYYTDDVALLKNALTFALTGDGIPIVYYGAEQQFSGLKDPDNREALWTSGYNVESPLYTAIAAVNAARNAIASASTYTYWSPYWTWKSKIIAVPGEMMAVRKGYDHSIVTITTNQGSNAKDMGPYTIGDTNFVEGDVIMEVMACTTQTVGQYGEIKTTIKKGEPQVWIKSSLMANSTICPSVDKKAQPTTTAKKGSSSTTYGAPANALFLTMVGILACALL